MEENKRLEGGNAVLVKEIIEGYNEGASFSNEIGTFNVSANRVKYTQLRNKYYSIAKEVQSIYMNDWTRYPGCNAFRKLADRKVITLLEEKMDEVKNDLISMGIFDVDTKSLMTYADKSGYFAEYQMAYDAFEQRYQQINGNLQYEKAKREYRKENRARWVGGSISSRPNYVDQYLHQAELGMRNMAEGAGHTVVNAIGNAMSTANANKQLDQLFRNKNVRDMFNEGVLQAVWNLHYVLMDFLIDKLNIYVWDFPAKDDIDKAERMLSNIGSSVLTEADRKRIIIEAFELNPYSDHLYQTMFDQFMDDADNISELAEYFGSDINSEKEKKAYEFLMGIIGNTEEEAKQAKEKLLQYYQKVSLHEYENLPSYQHITKTLEKFDVEYRTVDGILFDTRENADIAKDELPHIQEFMETIKPPVKEDTLVYEEELKAKRAEFDEKFNSKLKDKYLSVIDKYLLDFDKIFCTISLFKKGTREEAAQAKAVNFLKRQDTSTKEKREEALNLLREYLPKIGMTEAEATDAMEYLKKKEYEEYHGKESSFSKISKGLGSLFKK